MLMDVFPLRVFYGLLSATHSKGELSQFILKRWTEVCAMSVSTFSHADLIDESSH